MIDLDVSTQGMTVTAEAIRSLPTRDITDIASRSAGISTNPDQISIRGS